LKKGLLFCLLGFLLIFSLLSACTTSTTTPPTNTSSTNPHTSTTSLSTVVTSPSVQTNWWDKFGKPQYGGTIILAGGDNSANRMDPYDFIGGGNQLWLDNMFNYKWDLDRSTYAFNTDFVPVEYVKGNLVDTWEQTDPSTITIHLKQGIKWQNKAPVNGRELTANDVAFSYDRIFGLGNGYTQPSTWWGMVSGYFASVTATDKYTVVFKFNSSSALNFFQLTQMPGFNQIVAPEWVALGGPPPSSTSSTAAGGPPGGGPPGGGPPGPPGGGQAPSGPLNDWHLVVGTGPWMLTDFSSGSATTFTRNPNYFGHDERYPQNQLPYADQLKMLVIVDTPTALAALRTGKVDMVTSVSWVQGQSLSKTNPDLLQVSQPTSGVSLVFKNDNAPFTDIRIRQALQMAVDRKTIAQTVYGGTVNGVPSGSISPLFKDYSIPYDQWTADLQKAYSYDPTAAKQLLADAGFPNGLKTDIIASSSADLQLLQAIQAEFKDINVDMEIKMMDQASFMSFGLAGKHDAMSYQNMEVGSTSPPWVSLEYTSSLFPNFAFTKDAVYDKMCKDIESAPDLATVKDLCKKADMYNLTHYWEVRLFPTVTFTITQPRLKGYSGEISIGNTGYYARWWIDQSMNK